MSKATIATFYQPFSVFTGYGQTPHFARMSDGTLVAWYLEQSQDGQNTDLWRRVVSTDGGATWVSLNPSTMPPVQSPWGMVFVQMGDTILGLLENLSGTTTVWVTKWVYAGGAFADTLTTIALANPYNWRAYGAASGRADTVKSAAHFFRLLSADNGATIFAVLIAIDKAGATKLTEVRWQITGGNIGADRYGAALAIDSAASPKLWLAYTDSPTALKFRSYTFNGSAYTAADGEEAIESALVHPQNLVCALDGTGKLDVLYQDSSTVKTRKRTAVATWSAATSLVTDVYSYGSELILAEYGNANADLVLIYGDTSSTNVRYVKRIASTWSAAATIDTTLNIGEITGTLAVSSDGRAHFLWYDYKNQMNTLYYDFLGAAAAPTVANVLPTGTTNPAAPATVSAVYGEALSSDKLGKYLVDVRTMSDGTIMWNTGAIAAPGVATAALAAGTELGIGQYRYRWTFVTESNLISGTADGETPGGTEYTITTTGGNQRVSHTAIPLGPAGTIKRRLYRTLVGGATNTEKLVTTLNDNTTTAYTDLIVDGALGAAYPTTDSAAVFTSYAGADILNGGTFSIAYAGTALVKGTTYIVNVQFVESLDARASVLLGSFFSWTDPPVQFIAGLTADAASAKQKIAAMPGLRVDATEKRISTDLVPATCAFMRRAAGVGSFAALAAAAAVRLPTAESGLTFAQQLPVNGLGLNLAQDGAISTAFGRNMDANASIIADPAAPSGYTCKAVGTGYSTIDVIRAEATRAYSLGLSIKGDGTNNGECLIEWLDSSGTPISTLATLTRSTASYGDVLSTNATAPANTKFVRFKVRGAAASTGLAYFSSLRFKQQPGAVAAWSAGDQQYFPDSCAVFTAAAGNEQLPVPAGLTFGSWGATIVYEPTTSPHAAAAGLLQLRYDGTNDVRVRHTTADRIEVVVVRAGVGVITVQTSVLGSAVGDRITVSVTQDATGLYLDAKLNAGAWVSASDVSELGKLPLAGAIAQVYVGSIANVAQWADGKIGIVRLTKAMTSIQRQTATPYRLADDNDLAVWCWPGFGMQIPMLDDQAAGLGIGYDYRADTTAATPPGTAATGASLSASVAATTDGIWLKCPADPTLNLKLPVRYDTNLPMRRGRGAQVYEPVDGGPVSVAYAKSPRGEEFDIQLSLQADPSLKAKLYALQASDNDLYLLDPIGGTRKVRFSDAPIEGPVHAEGYYEASFHLIEVA